MEDKFEEYNVLIARFMGFAPNEDGYWHIYYGEGDDFFESYSLEYHHSWSWLMPVVEKIESFEDDYRCCKYNVNIQQSWVEVIDNENSNEIVAVESSGTLLTKIEVVHLAVVEFIKWYNKNQKA
tara:strand:+ start:448 stop:819 length:372 start_codon:yes stop_codon:yes gene_type:complete